MQITPDQLAECHPEALDALAQSSRRSLAERLGETLMTAGQQVHVYGAMFGSGRIDGSSPFGNGDDGLVELGYISQATAELVAGATALLHSGNLYPAAALIRQVVEMEYLVWSFGERKAAAGDWLRSSREDRRSFWQPAKLRDASGGRFDASEYWIHCEIGGHPTPPGVRALLGTTVDRVIMTELQWHELCYHGTRVWRSLLVATAVHDVPLKDSWDDLNVALEQWRSTDRLADAIASKAEDANNRGTL